MFLVQAVRISLKYIIYCIIYLSLFAIWPARAPKRGTAEFARLIRNYTLPTNGSGRSKGGQAGMQLAAIPVTILIAVISGLLTGNLTH